MSDVTRWDVVDIVDLFQRFRKTPPEFVSALDYDRLADEVEQLRTVLSSLHRKHDICEDCWYSCPKSDEGCCDHRQTECNCGADRVNAIIDSALGI